MTTRFAEDSLQQQALLHQLRTSNDPVAREQVEQLSRLYHDRQMGGLADDVYDAAKHQGVPPAGWLRGSENLDQLRTAVPEWQNLSDKQLLATLQPGESGFRAEIYLPDSAILGPGYKPTLVFKGSAGEVAGADGKLRDTIKEDFLANNFPQSVGLKTDYYDRAMRLGADLKRAGLDFEIAGHSLGGGMSAACAAVTDMPATTFNAAGLHPQTATRFVRENPDVMVHDVSHRVISYQVNAELLNDGVQGNVTRMDEVKRQQLAGVMKETADLLRELPQGRAALQGMLERDVPVDSRPTVKAFVDTLATGDTARLLRELPLAAGQQQPMLEAMTGGKNGPVQRANTASLQEITQLAGPALTTLRMAATGAHVGHRAGEGVAAGGRMADKVLDSSGDSARMQTQIAGLAGGTVTRAAGDTVGAGLRHGGDVVARMREQHAAAEASIDHAQGRLLKTGADWAARALHAVGAEDLAKRVHGAGEQAQRRHQAEATEAIRNGQQDTAAIRGAADRAARHTVDATHGAADLQQRGLAGAGERMDQAMDSTGRLVKNATAQAPTAGALAGGVTTGAVGGFVSNHPLTGMPQTVKLAAQALPAGQEAFERHLMTETVVPSLDHRIEQAEQEARRQLQAEPLSRIDQPNHPGHALFKQGYDSLLTLNQQYGRTPDERDVQAAGAMAAAASLEKMSGIDRIVLSDDRDKMFAIQGEISSPSAKFATLPTMQALYQPLEQSTTQFDQAHQARQTEQQQTLAQAPNNPTPGGPRLG